MANNYFNFKTFSIQQEGCAMKVCTDSCLFGAWIANYLSEKEQPPNSILDIGTGTGLLTLMLAQKTDANFVAVEIDRAAADVAKVNIANAAMPNDIKVLEIDFLQFASEKKFDFIISNPPFYDNDLISSDEGINIARHQNGLTIQTLANHCASLLNDSGEIALLAPFKREKTFIEAMHEIGFSPQEICRVKHHPTKAFIRSMMIFKKQPAHTSSNEIAIRDEDNNYRDDFKMLLSDYYLDF